MTYPKESLVFKVVCPGNEFWDGEDAALVSIDPNKWGWIIIHRVKGGAGTWDGMAHWDVVTDEPALKKHLFERDRKECKLVPLTPAAERVYEDIRAGKLHENHS